MNGDNKVNSSFVRIAHELLTAATQAASCQEEDNESVQVEVFFIGSGKGFVSTVQTKKRDATGGSL